MTKHLRLAATLTATALAAGAVAAQEAVPIERCGRLADALAVWTDASGSMMKKDGETSRTEDLRTLLAQLSSEAFEPHGITTSVRSVAPYAVVLSEAKRTTEDMRRDLDSALPNLETFGRPSLLGNRAMTLFSEVQKPRTVTLFVTDGQPLAPPLSADPDRLIQAFDAFAASNPSSCLHLLSAARTPEEKARIADLSSHPAVCPKVEELPTLVSDDSARQAFVERVFYRDCSTVKSISLSAVLFKFDRADLTPKGREYLKGILPILKTHLAEHPMTVVGHTCTTGPESYNLRLSQRRAESVVRFLTVEGLDAARITAKGLGESTAFDNRTREGRAKNRRVEMTFTE